jgi:putative ABC transport system substrate-binding protein
MAGVPITVRRRQFLIATGMLLVAPLAAEAQQAGKVRRISVLSGTAKSDREVQSRLSAFSQGLNELGWKDGGNLRIDYRFGEGDPTRLPQLARELLELRPDVVVAFGFSAATAFRQQTLAIPIVFVQVGDPVAAGFVTNLARPDGNITGFTSFEFSISGKWLEIIKECAPNASGVLVVFDPRLPSWTPYMRAIEASAPKFGMQLTPAGAHNATEIEHEIGMFAKLPNGALVVLPSPLTTTHRERIIALAARHRLPAVYPYSYFTASGGLMSYGVHLPDLYRRAASYVDRILNGAKPADLPVQQPTKFELVINVKTAKALGLKIPQSVLVRADRVIE